MTPQPGDVINTTGIAPFGLSWHKLSRWTVTQGIHAYQRWLRGYPHPAWTRTHTRLCIDRDLIMSVTDPVCKWETWAEVEAMYPPENIKIMRPKFHDYSIDGDAHLLCAAANLIGRKYDRGQLVDIMLNRLLGIPDGEFTRIFDAGTARTVCSGGVAACFEYHRLSLPEHLRWPRLFGGMYIERVPPAAFEALPRGAEWEMEFEHV